jgi:hypothetical protein
LGGSDAVEEKKRCAGEGSLTRVLDREGAQLTEKAEHVEY